MSDQTFKVKVIFGGGKGGIEGSWESGQTLRNVLAKVAQMEKLSGKGVYHTSFVSNHAFRWAAEYPPLGKLDSDKRFTVTMWAVKEVEW